MAKASPKITSDDLRDRLRKHVLKDGVNGGGFVYINEVRNGTGYTRREGYCDAIGMDLWPSRGLLLTGFELKVSRNDWLKELKNPQKAETFFQYCDRWFLVVGDKDIVKEGELPEPWGLIVPRGKGLTIAKAAPVDKRKVKPIDRLFLAALLRSAVQHAASRKQLEEVRAKAYEEGVARGEQSRSFKEETLRELRESVQRFEKAAGVSLTRWYANGKPEEIGAALKVVLTGEKDASRILGRLARVHGDIESLLDEHGIDKDNPPDAY